MLEGRKTRWSTAHPWVEQLGFHGVLRGWKEERIRLLLSELIAAGLARQSSGEYPVVELTTRGRAAVAGGTLPALTLPAEANRSGAAYAPVELVDRLRRWWSETARATGIPAYVVFRDSTLTAIAVARTKSLGDLLRVSGVGESKLRKYGEEVLEVLRGA